MKILSQQANPFSLPNSSELSSLLGYPIHLYTGGRDFSSPKPDCAHVQTSVRARARCCCCCCFTGVFLPKGKPARFEPRGLVPTRSVRTEPFPLSLDIVSAVLSLAINGRDFFFFCFSGKSSFSCMFLRKEKFRGSKN